jgi:hypothetical protein
MELSRSISDGQWGAGRWEERGFRDGICLLPCCYTVPATYMWWMLASANIWSSPFLIQLSHNDIARNWDGCLPTVTVSTKTEMMRWNVVMVQQKYVKWSGNAVCRINSETETCFQWKKTELDTKRRAYSTAFMYHLTRKVSFYRCSMHGVRHHISGYNLQLLGGRCRPISFHVE